MNPPVRRGSYRGPSRTNFTTHECKGLAVASASAYVLKKPPRDRQDRQIRFPGADDAGFAWCNSRDVAPESRASRLRHRLRALVLVGTSIIAASAATAQPLTPFRYAAQAQRHCPGDAVVWLDFGKGIYYVNRLKRYGQGSTGSFVCRKEARAGGFRRSLLGLR
jgi:hypothetical protein